MTPERFSAWQTIVRDTVVTILAAFMLVFETVYAAEPNAYLIGAGITLLGVPAALRLDSFRRKADRDE